MTFIQPVARFDISSMQNRWSDVDTIRFLALLAAVFLYACAGSPSPDNPGMIEIALALLLVMAVGAPAAMRSFLPAAKWEPGNLFLLYGFLIALPAAALHGNDPAVALRDMLPFLFLFLPLFAGDIFENRPEFLRWFIYAFTAAGIIFALRGLGEASIYNATLSSDTKELYYFANAPSVLFAAVFPAGVAMNLFLKQPSARSMFILAIGSALVFFPLLAMAATLQRASLGWAFACYGLFFALSLWRCPLRTLFLAMMGVVVLYVFSEQSLRVFDLLSHKTAVYGVNKRGMEMEAVWLAISSSLPEQLFGIGWGGTFNDPAVGGVRVNYTHSLLTGALLKTGLSGLVLAVLYLSGFFARSALIFRNNVILGLAIAGPLAIDVFLYASYKWLDFGLLLLLIRAASDCRRLHPIPAYCIQRP